MVLLTRLTGLRCQIKWKEATSSSVRVDAPTHGWQNPAAPACPLSPPLRSHPGCITKGHWGHVRGAVCQRLILENAHQAGPSHFDDGLFPRRC